MKTVISLLLCLISLGCDGNLHVDGHVIDAEGSPIVGAIVVLVEGQTLSRTALPDVTDENGAFEVDLITGGPVPYDLTLTASHPEFKTYTETISSRVHQLFDHEIVLKRKDPSDDPE